MAHYWTERRNVTQKTMCCFWLRGFRTQLQADKQHNRHHSKAVWSAPRIRREVVGKGIKKQTIQMNWSWWIIAHNTLRNTLCNFKTIYGSLNKAEVSRRKDGKCNSCFSLFLKKSQSIRESSVYFSSWKNTGKISQAIIHKYWKEKSCLSEE